MKKSAVVALCGWLAAAPVALAPVAVYAAAGAEEKATDDAAAMRSSVEVLLEALQRVGAEKGQQSASGHVVKRVSEMLVEADDLVAAGQVAQGRALLDEALVTLKSAIAGLRQGETLGGNGSPVEASSGRAAKDQGDYRRQLDSLDALTTALESIGQEKQEAATPALLDQVARLRGEAEQLVQAGQAADALDVVRKAQLLVKNSISALRGGETLVRSLEFASKADEYAYEVDRFETYEMLLELLVAQRVADQPQLQAQVKALHQQAQQERSQAEASAGKGDYEQAVFELERAAQTLLKAIRRGGVYVPG